MEDFGYEVVCVDFFVQRLQHHGKHNAGASCRFSGFPGQRNLFGTTAAVVLLFVGNAEAL